MSTLGGFFRGQILIPNFLTPKRHSLAWDRVVWGIARNKKNPPTGLTCRWVSEKKVYINKNFQCIFHPCGSSTTRVPVALHAALREELDSRTQNGILCEVKEPTDWVNSCVCVTKPNGKMRLSLDPKALNRAIKRLHRYRPTLEDILPKLSGAKFFSILDARCGHWNVKLDGMRMAVTTTLLYAPCWSVPSPQAHASATSKW